MINLKKYTLRVGIPKEPMLAILTLLLFTIGVSAQGDLIKLRIQVVLIDKDLNQKAVPKFVLSLRRIGSTATTEALSVKTDLNGLADVELHPGQYSLSTPQAVEFRGKRYSWGMEIKVSSVQNRLELTNDNATITEAIPDKSARIMDELSASFQRLKNSVVTVWSEFGHGTGFIVDADGLVMTNQHVIGPSEYISVQFDEKRKIPAVLLAADAEKDVAVLWVNLSALPDATVAPIAKIDGSEPTVVEGERIFTIGSPLDQRKVITTGIASKIERRAIISDININHGNSGGPLFNSLASVVGITTFGVLDRQGGPGLSGIVRIEEAMPVLAQARARRSEKQKPTAALLPVDPVDPFPLDAIKAMLYEEKFDFSRYYFSMGDYDVSLMTPILKYRLTVEGSVRAAREKERRNRKKEGSVTGTFRPLDDLKSWAEYVGGYKPVIMIRARPRLGESFWNSLGRGLAAYNGTIVQAKLRFKSDFYKMKLMCGDRVAQPILPAKIAHVYNENNRFVNLTDAAYEGLYSYTADAISPSCGQVRLEIYSEKQPNEPTVKTLDLKTVMRIAADLGPYLRASIGRDEVTSTSSSEAAYPSTISDHLSVGDTMRSAFDVMTKNAKTAAEATPQPGVKKQEKPEQSPESKQEARVASKNDEHSATSSPSSVKTNRIGQETNVEFGNADSFLFAKTLDDHFLRAAAEKRNDAEGYNKLKKAGKLREVHNHSRVRILSSSKDSDGSDVFEIMILSTKSTVWMESKFLK